MAADAGYIPKPNVTVNGQLAIRVKIYEDRVIQVEKKFFCDRTTEKTVRLWVSSKISFEMKWFVKLFLRKVWDKAVSASRLVKSPMRENRVRVWVEVVDSLQCTNTRGIAEFNEIPPWAKCDESKAAIRGRKVAGLAVHKHIAEFNEIPTVKGAALGAD